MASDVQLHCERTWLGKRRIVIREPAELRKTPYGTFATLPPEWISTDRLIASVEVLDKWARDAVGDAIVRAINQHAQRSGGLVRVLISSEETLRADVLAAPWELLEHTPSALRSAQLSVVRLLDEHAASAAPEPVPRLTLLALYADPANNIAELQTHIEALRNFAAANDEMLHAKILSFDTADSVLQECAGFDPHVVYFIGHGSQTGNDQLRLQIGDGPGMDMSAFAAFLRRVGSPRVVILNACESFAGSTLDPYLGAALRLSPQFDFIVTMQMKEPIPAATEFAAALLAAIARGEGLAAAMSAARTAMAASAERDFEVTPYIPVLMQRTRQDVPYSVDVCEHERVRLQKLMSSRLEQIDSLPRRAEEAIRRALLGEAGTRRVSILTGAPECGKSTTVRCVVDALLTADRFMKGDRYLYFSAKNLPPTHNLAEGVSQLLQAFARDCGEFTRSLHTSLGTDARRNPQASPVSTLATWLELRNRSGYHFSVVFDDLDCTLATEIATRASGIVTAGHVMLISDAHALRDEAMVERLTLGPMTKEEIANALPGWDTARVQQVFDETGGIPLFVAAAKRGHPVHDDGLIEDLLKPLSAQQRETLSLIAMSELPLPPEVAAELRIDQTLLNGMIARGLASLASDAALSVPKKVRDALLAPLTEENAVTLRHWVAAAYETVAYRERTGRFRRPRVISLYKEALQQRVRVLDRSDVDPSPEDTLAEARADLFDLDYELLEEGDEPGEAIILWKQYRKATARFADDREADARYARLLQRLGSIGEADEILESLTVAGHADGLQILILLQRDDALHDLGGSHEDRLRLLTRAREIHDKLRAAGTVNARELDEYEGQIEQAFGNALGYGEGAEPKEAVRHLAHAVEIFERMRDYRADSAYAEKTEIARYNKILAEKDRIEAIERIRKSTEALLARSVQREAINRLYELGRLEADPRDKAKWYRAAYERAGDGYAPIRWHAAIHWKCAEVKANERSFADAAPEIIAYCRELDEWKESSWSRRVLRDALRFLADHYAAAGDLEQQRRFLLQCWDVIHSIEQRGERRRDCEVRAEVDEEIRGLPAGTGTPGGDDT